MHEKQKCLAVIRVRGAGEASPEIRKTLNILHLNRNCHITLVDNRPSYVGMLKKAKDFVAWGEITNKNILLLLEKRGRVTGDKKLDQKYAKEIGYKDLEKIAEAIHNLKTDLKQLDGVKPVFRGHPPRKGYKGKVKKSYAAGGVTGYRGEAINELIEKMI